jgi:hypothetical protein
LHITLSTVEISEYEPATIKINPNNGGILINTAPNNKIFPISIFLLSLSLLLKMISKIIETRIGK